MVRISGGQLKGRRLETVRRTGFRPTAERVREALFAIIGDQLQDAVILDLFAGVGTVGIEALSRGAQQALFIEQNRICARALLRNLESCKLLDAARVLMGSVRGRLPELQSTPADIVFMDPPYGKGLVQDSLELIDKLHIVKPAGLVIAEQSIHGDVSEPSGFTLKDKREYGDTLLLFYGQNKL